MIHKFTAIIELSFDDEQGEYAPPSIHEIENKIGNAIHAPLRHMGFEKITHLEAAKGSMSTAFGVE